MSTPTQGQRSAGELVALYTPRSAPAPAAAFARAVVAEALPASPARAKALLFACSKLACYGIRVGLEPTPTVLFDEAVIERFVASGTDGLSAATRRTLRSNLLALKRTLAPASSPGRPAYPRERSKQPYSTEEIAGYLANAAAQPTLARRMRASALVCLGAGAGLMGAELRRLRGCDVSSRHGGLVVSVSPPRARVVPVLARYHEALREAAGFAGESYLVGGRDPHRYNVTTRLVASLSGGTHLPRLETSRLRATWLAHCAEAIGLPAFMAAAGVVCSQRIGDVVSYLQAPSEAEMVALLGAAR